MRFIHTADWHLGRLFHGTHLTDDQCFVLKQFCQLVRDCKPDAVVIAGDIYDRAVPPPDAIRLLDDVLSELVLDVQVPVLMIAGNHDSPGRLNFGSRLLAGRRLYVAGHLTNPCPPLILNDSHGPVYFYSIPYAEPGMVRNHFGCGDAADHDTAMRHMLDCIRLTAPPGVRKVLIGHAFVDGGTECTSERPLSVGTAGTVNAAHFSEFDYVALGHLHAAQTIDDGIDPREGRIRYSGSLLKYSFDEADHEKAVLVVDMNAEGVCVCEHVALPPLRDVRRISGRMADLLAADATSPAVRDYLEITLLDEMPIADAMGQLRMVYPNVLTLPPNKKDLPSGINARPTISENQHPELFKGFFTHTTGDPLSLEQEIAYASVIESMLAREREAETVKDNQLAAERKSRAISAVS